MSVSADCDTLYQATVEEFGGVDILVNNAAGASLVTLAEENEEDFLRVMRTNVWAPLHLARLCRKSMRQRGGGAVINITSNEGVRPVHGHRHLRPVQGGPDQYGPTPGQGMGGR